MTLPPDRFGNALGDFLLGVFGTVLRRFETGVQDKTEAVMRGENAGVRR